MKILGLIPARGGSKGVPRKNIKLLCGKPLIQYTIDAAKAANCLTEIMVSTEDQEIAQVAQQLGASVPFLRPSALAGDKSPTIDAVIHVLEEFQKLGKYFDAVCLLQATNPLRTAELIKKSIEKFTSTAADSLISVREIPHEFNPHWAFEEENETQFLKIATGEKNIIPRRQELPKAYYRDGSIYLTKSEIILNQKSLYGERITHLNVQQYPHVNIDTIDDWKLAQTMLSEEQNL